MSEKELLLKVISLQEEVLKLKDEVAQLREENNALRNNESITISSPIWVYDPSKIQYYTGGSSASEK